MSVSGLDNPDPGTGRDLPQDLFPDGVPVRGSAGDFRIDDSYWSPRFCSHRPSRGIPPRSRRPPALIRSSARLAGENKAPVA